MERKLASIQEIRDIVPIKGADNIELATINNWKVVVAKDVGHSVGDMVVYCEIDSFLPVRDEFEFLRKTSHRKMAGVEGFRLKTLKLRGAISQGLILPISIFGDFGWTAYVGLDVTHRLGIVKYDPPIPAELAGIAKGNFPSFIPKTDENRIQNLTDEFVQWKADPTLQWYETEKLDGSSVTYFYNQGQFGVCSRNLELERNPDNTLWRVAAELKIEETLIDMGINLAIQGEMIGEGIQGNPYKLSGQHFFAFNMFDIDTQSYYGLPMFMATAEHTLDIKTVPIINMDYKLPDTIDEILEHVNGQSVLNSQARREGSVIRSLDRTKSFKGISNKFLLKHGS